MTKKTSEDKWSKQSHIDAFFNGLGATRGTLLYETEKGVHIIHCTKSQVDALGLLEFAKRHEIINMCDSTPKKKK